MRTISLRDDRWLDGVLHPAGATLSVTDARASELVSSGRAKYATLGGGIWVRKPVIKCSQSGVLTDGRKNNGPLLRELLTRAASGEGIVSLDEPGPVLVDEGLDIASCYLEIHPGVDLVMLDASANRVRVLGQNCGIIAAKGTRLIKARCRRYRLSAGAVVGNVFTATLLEEDLQGGDNPFVPGDQVEFRNTAGLATTIEGLERTITAVDGLTITCAHTSADSELTVPVEREDGWNMGVYAIYPTVQLQRTSSNHDIGIWVSRGAQHVRLENVEIIGGTSAGVLAQGVAFAEFLGITARQTGADGFMVRDESYNVLIRDFEADQTGDDGLSVVGFCEPTGKPPTNITVDGAFLHDLLYNGRGLAVLGCKHSTFKGVRVNNAYHAGIYAGRDSSYGTYGVQHCKFLDFHLHTCGGPGSVPTGWNTAAYAALTLTGSNTSQRRMQDVEFRDFSITNARSQHISTSDIKSACRDVTIEDGSLTLSRQHAFTLAAPDALTLRRLKIVYSRNSSAIGNEKSVGRQLVRDLAWRHVNEQITAYIASIACSNGTITITTKEAHGLSATTVTVSLRGIGSDAEDADDQLLDEALNGTYGPATTAWAGTTAYSKGDIRRPTSANGFRYICVTAGTSGGSEPTWPTTEGDEVGDGTARWRCLSRYYSSISYPNSTTILIEGTQKSSSVAPRVYTPGGSPSPQAYVATTHNSGNDVLTITTGTPEGSIDIDRCYLVEQERPLDDMLVDASSGAISSAGVLDLTGVAAG